MASEAARRASSTWSRASASSRRVSERAPHEHLDRLEAGRGVGQGSRLGLDGIVGGQGEDGPEALEGAGQGGLGADHGVARLGRLQLGPEHVELAGEAHLETGLGGLPQPLRALEALPGHFEELALGHHRVEGRRHLHREPLPREDERALLPLPRPARVLELEEAGVRPHPAQERLGEHEPEVGRFWGRGRPRRAG